MALYDVNVFAVCEIFAAFCCDRGVFLCFDVFLMCLMTVFDLFCRCLY